MFILLLIFAWLSVSMLVLGACVASARSDTASREALSALEGERSRPRTMLGWDDPAVAVRAHRGPAAVTQGRARLHSRDVAQSVR